MLGAAPLCCSTPQIDSGCVRFEADRLTIDLEKAAALRPVGSAAAVVDTARGVNLIVAHTGKNDFAALDRSCTHGGAQCTYNHKRRTVQCTSLNHAEFDLKGTLLHGRTHGNLRAYKTRRTGSLLEIRLGA
jgi:nitrite reductase/ring-hydroxylating ferredoxin subunit